MKKVTFYQAKDGSNHETPKLCAEHDQKLLLTPAVEAFVGHLDAKHFNQDDRGNVVISQEDLSKFIIANADALRAVLTEPLVVRRPRKSKEVKAGPASPQKDEPAASQQTEAAAAVAHVLTEEEELEAAVAALNA